jgi:hypothetical protein
LPGLSYKGLSLNILFEAWAFPNDHQFGLFVAFSEYECAPGFVEFASPTIPKYFSNFFQRLISLLSLFC